MKLSVVTVVRNDPAVASTVSSVLAQKGLDVECVVIDGASTDGTLAALKPMRRRIRLFSEPDSGIYDAMNKGLHRARGRVVGFLNAGDVFLGDHNLAEVSRAFSSDKGLGACFSGLEISDPQGKRKRWWPASEYQPGAFAAGWMPSHPTFYALRRPLLDLGGFDLRYRLAADYDLMLRALEQAQLRSVALPLCLVRMRSGGASQASLGALWRHNREAWSAATAAGTVRCSFGRFLARKWSHKWRQVLDARFAP
ncbi:MAG TPA: glycosyltransferase family 2 protein [bacterium]|jgi:glycosyltransferase involved in cell wall biosynthesis|nr:glycosyltransferase family 2 protein [bacterium]